MRIESVTEHSTRALARGHVIAQDKPAPKGEDTAPMATELLLAALGACQITTAHAIAAKRRKPVERIVIEGTLQFSRGVISRIFLDVTLHGAVGQEDADTIVRLAERSCTVSQALRVPIEATVHVVHT